MKDQQADLTWRDGNVPVSARFDDPYFSLDNGLEETRHVFLAANGLPDRLRDGFQIAELGFGTGLNALATALEWERAGRQGLIRFTSFEAYPMRAGDIARALAMFPELSHLSEPLIRQWGASEMQIGKLHLTLVVGDARDTLPDWVGKADAWYLDGFAPARNPELWQPNLLQSVADHTHPGGTAATYSAAGHVRRALSNAGFSVERVPGYGRKRHMVRAHKP